MTRFMTDQLFDIHLQRIYLLSVCDRRY